MFNFKHSILLKIKVSRWKGLIHTLQSALVSRRPAGVRLASLCAQREALQLLLHSLRHPPAAMLGSRCSLLQRLGLRRRVQGKRLQFGLFFPGRGLPSAACRPRCFLHRSTRWARSQRCPQPSVSACEEPRVSVQTPQPEPAAVHAAPSAPRKVPAAASLMSKSAWFTSVQLVRVFF